MYQVKGKWALITGAARGIGYLTAKFMAEQGCNLILHSRDLAHTEKVLAEVRSRAKTSIEELRDSYSVVLLSHYETEFLVEGSPFTYSLPITFDNYSFGEKAGFNQKLKQYNSAVVVKNGVHKYYNYKSRMNSPITISKDVTLSFDDDLVITWRQATGKIKVDKFPTLVKGPINSGCKIEGFAFIPDLKVFIAEPEEMDNVHLQVEGSDAKIITKDGKQFFYIRPCATISNMNDVKELQSSVKDSGTVGDKRLSLKKGSLFILKVQKYKSIKDFTYIIDIDL